ncbi:MAG: hypothetical protein WKF97_20865 [Chitinophagaceae bacterium]
MGGPEIAYELTDLLQDPSWDRLWLQFCKLYGASPEEVGKALGKPAQLGQPGPWYARLPAYAAKRTNDPKYAQRAWNEFLNEKTKGQFDSKMLSGHDVIRPLEEVPGISTNHTAQWCLNAIQLLAMVGDKIPEDNPLWAKE